MGVEQEGLRVPKPKDKKDVSIVTSENTAMLLLVWGGGEMVVNGSVQISRSHSRLSSVSSSFRKPISHFICWT